MSDGITHINIYSKGETELGRHLSNFSGDRIVVTDGEFASIEAYWYWLNTSSPRREELRNTVGWKAKALGRELRAIDWNSDGMFKMKIINAMVTKMILNPNIYHSFRSSTLPFCHYYVYNGKTVTPKEGEWIIDTWEFIRRIVKEA